jgi:hypothetical protein
MAVGDDVANEHAPPLEAATVAPRLYAARLS